MMIRAGQSRSNFTAMLLVIGAGRVSVSALFAAKATVVVSGRPRQASHHVTRYAPLDISGRVTVPEIGVMETLFSTFHQV